MPSSPPLLILTGLIILGVLILVKAKLGHWLAWQRVALIVVILFIALAGRSLSVPVASPGLAELCLWPLLPLSWANEFRNYSSLFGFFLGVVVATQSYFAWSFMLSGGWKPRKTIASHTSKTEKRAPILPNAKPEFKPEVK